MIKVVLSEHDLFKKEGVEQVFNVSRTLVYYLYNYRTYDNDIMLLKVSEGNWSKTLFIAYLTLHS